MKTTIVTSALALLVPMASAACGGSQQNRTEQSVPTMASHPMDMENAIETRWLVAFLDEETMLVKLRPGQQAVEPNAEAAEDMVRAIAEAAEIQHGTDFRDAFADLDIDTGDAPGEVSISGRLDSETEAVAVIDAALSVEGVQRVRANLEWPGSRMELSQLFDQYR